MHKYVVSWDNMHFDETCTAEYWHFSEALEHLMDLSHQGFARFKKDGIVVYRNMTLQHHWLYTDELIPLMKEQGFIKKIFKPYFDKLGQFQLQPIFENFPNGRPSDEFPQAQEYYDHLQPYWKKQREIEAKRATSKGPTF